MDKPDRDWAAIIAEFESSGLSQVEFARQRGIPSNTLSYNLRKLRQAEDPNLAPKRKKDSDFIRVVKPQMIELVATSGVTIRLPEDTSADRIQAIVEKLK